MTQHKDNEPDDQPNKIEMEKQEMIIFGLKCDDKSLLKFVAAFQFFFAAIEVTMFLVLMNIYEALNILKNTIGKA